MWIAATILGSPTLKLKFRKKRNEADHHSLNKINLIMMLEGE